ncbi:helix-turn-helix domain-containing protein [Streptomyces sp. NPDC055134]
MAAEAITAAAWTDPSYSYATNYISDLGVRECGTKFQTLARDCLRTDQSTLAQSAERTGYASPYAFAAAFRRHHGEAPGQWRQQQLERCARSEDGTGATGDGVRFV